MGLGSLLRLGGKYFDKNISPKCDYCQFGKRAKEGNKVICEKNGLVDLTYSCSRFSYSPLKRIPVKQLNFVGSLADDDIYIESAGDIAEKEELQNIESNKSKNEKSEIPQKTNADTVKSDTVEENTVTSDSTKKDDSEKNNSESAPSEE